MARSFRSLAESCISRCLKIAKCTETPGVITRTFLSPPMQDCHRLLTGWMTELGMQVRTDAIGNLRGLLGGGTSPARLLIGSHLDSVPNAGPLDGVLGVCLALSLVEVADERLDFDIEVIGFSEEEGVRFQRPFLGSLAAVGKLDAATLALKDAAGVTMSDAIRQFGLDPAKLSDAELDGRTAAFLEFHIEQGPVLDRTGESVAAVTSIAGQSRWEFTFSGHANHAGTTPMEFRRDALAGCAQWIASVETVARSMDGLVATVGRLQVTPNAGNVVPGESKASLDVRHPCDETRIAAVNTLRESADHIAAARHLTLRCEELLDQAAAPMNSKLVEMIEDAIQQSGALPRRMVSGAGHDAMIMASRVPSAMVFVRSPGGISHHPDESVRVADVEKAIEVGSLLLSRFSKERFPTA